MLIDRGFAAPKLINQAKENDLQVIVRVKDSVARRLLSNAQNDGSIVWRSQKENISLHGRVVHIKNQIPGFRSSELYIFTNTSFSDERISEPYLQRVQVEVAIRHIKQTLGLSFIAAKNPDAIRKEIYIAFLTFNLIRAIMEDVAITYSIPIKRLSFSAALSLVKASSFKLLIAKPSEKSVILAKLAKLLSQSLLPQRKKPRSYLRVVKLPIGKYPSASAIKMEEGK